MFSRNKCDAILCQQNTRCPCLGSDDLQLREISVTQFFGILMRSSLVSLIIVSLIISGCTADGKSVIPEKYIPAAAGAGAAVLCRSMFKDAREKNIATVVCGSLGVLVGQKIKQYLSEKEQVRLAQATDKTLTTGQKQSFKTEEGSSITTEFVKPTAKTPAKGAECGTVKQTIVTKDNQKFEETVSACKKGDTWVAE